MVGMRKDIEFVKYHVRLFLLTGLGSLGVGQTCIELNKFRKKHSWRWFSSPSKPSSLGGSVNVHVGNPRHLYRTYEKYDSKCHLPKKPNRTTAT